MHTHRSQDKSSPWQSSTNSGWEEVFEDSVASQDIKELEDAMRIELQIYLKEKRSNTTMDSLKYLEGEYANSQKYPNLAKILRRYYCPLPGSAASERLLSTAR